jgi:hypothetical protein
MRIAWKTISLLLLILMAGLVLAQESADDPYTIKMANRAAKETGRTTKVVVTDTTYRRAPNITEKTVANGFVRHELPEPRRLDPKDAIFLPAIAPTKIDYKPVRSTPSSARPSYSETPPWEPGEAEAFMASDILVSIPNTRPQRQPHCVTGTDGHIYAVWGEAISGGANAIMFSKSTDAGHTWSTAIVVDNVGTNYSPRVAVYGTGFSAIVHVVYNYVDWHVQDYYDTSGTYLYTDTIFEGDVYYARSTSGGSTFGAYQAIANRDINILFININYDEGGPDINVDGVGNVCITYYGQADEGHYMSMAIMILLIILYEGLPPFWIDYTWYDVNMRASINHGGTFGSRHRIMMEWFMDNSLTGSDVQGTGSSAITHCIYTATGILSLGSATSYYRRVTNPFFSPSNSMDNFVASGYVAPSGLRVDSLGNTRAGVTQISGWGYDVFYSMTTNGGISWPLPTPVAASVADEWEPRLRLDAAANTFLVWSDERHINTDVYCVWSEDGGRTLRSDQHRVNQTALADQLWPGIGLFLSDTTRRLDVVWWDTWHDPDGDIYYNNANWWRTNFNVMLHDSLANPMGGTVMIRYRSFDVQIIRPISTGYHIIYHDPGTQIAFSRLSSGSDAVERWIYHETDSFVVTPPVPGNTYNVVYYDQYYTTFSATIANSPACTVSTIPSFPFTYEYFALTEVRFTDHTGWANVRGEYNYPGTHPTPPTGDWRWYCPEPTGLVLSPSISPNYYFQYRARFNDPRKLNDAECTHTIPHFTLVQRYHGGINLGGTTPYTGWTDCGSSYEYEDPKVVSESQRWDIIAGATGVVDGTGPYEPAAYHQWRPTINLIGPYLPENPTYCETLYVGGVRTGVSNLASVYQPWADCGSPLWMGEFTTLGWVARDPRVFDPVVSAFMANIRYGNVVSVILRNDFGYGFLLADGDTVTSGFPLGWAPTSEHTICAISPQVYGMTRFVFDHWSDFGDTCHMVVPVGDTTWTAYFNKEYYLDIISDHGTPWGEGWYNEGEIANFGVEAVTAPVGGMRYLFIGWEGSGVGSYTGSDSSADVTMNNPITETARWHQQFRIDLTYTGSDGIVPVQTGDGWYSGASMPTITTDSIIGDDGPDDTLRYVFSHWESTPGGATFGNPFHASTPIFVDRPYTCTAVYRRQWSFYVETSDTGLGSPVPALGKHWCFEGEPVLAYVTSPDGGMYCVGYLGFGSLIDGSLPIVTFDIYRPSRIIWLWGDQYIFTVTSDPYEWIMGMASPNPPAGTYYYVPGARDTFYVNPNTPEMGGMRYHCAGWTGSGPDEAAEGGDTNEVIITMTSSGELRWQFEQQLRFVVVSAHDSPDPTAGVHWFPSGTHLSPRVDPVDGMWRCIGYNLVIGGMPTTGYGYSFEITVSVPCSLNWLWADVGDVESLLVISDHGPVAPPAGLWNYFLRGTSFDAWSVMFDLSDTLDGIRHRCIGWTGTGPVPATGDSTICPITMTSSGTLRWNWQAQYLVHIECEHDNPQYSFNGVIWHNLDPVSNIWAVAGMPLYLRVNNIVDTLAGDSLVYCNSWHGYGASVVGLDTMALNFNFNVIDPCTIIYNWTSILYPLYVYTEHGGPIPSDTTWWLPGARVDAFVTTPWEPGVPDGHRWICTGWTGTGSAPASGAGSAMSFEITDTSSITWHWQEQYRLSIYSWPREYDSPFPPLGHHWYNAGTPVSGYVTHPVWDDPDTMYCVGFNGTGSAPVRDPHTDFAFTLDEPSNIEWLWYPRDTVALLTVRSDYGSPWPHRGMTAWVKGSVVDATVDSAVVVGPAVYECVGWRGYGSAPVLGDSNHVVFPIWVDSDITWQWSNLFSFTITNPGGFGDPEPDPGVYMHMAGAWVFGQMLNHPFWTGTDTMYCVGYRGSGDLPVFDPHTDFGFNITMNSSCQWMWSDDAVTLTVNTPYGSPWPHGLTYWIPGTIVPDARVDSAVIVSPGIRAYCTGWTGTGSTPPSGIGNHIPDFIITDHSTITWEWQMQYAFTVTNEGPLPGGFDTPFPPVGTHWYFDGDTVAAWIRDNPAPPPHDSMFCIGMTGTGSAPVFSPQDSIWFAIHMPSTCNWHWLPEDSVARLTVHSDHGWPQIPWGITYWRLFSNIDASVMPWEEVDSVSRYFCTGFDLVSEFGSIDTSDTFNSVFFIIEENTDLFWNWMGQFYLSLFYEGLSSPPGLYGEGWYNENDTAFYECETPVLEGGSYYGFVHWSVDPVSDTTLRGDTLFFHNWQIMDQPYEATAHYGPAVFVSILKDPEENDQGWIKVDLIEYDSTSILTTWWGRGSYHLLEVPDLDSTATGERYRFDHWSDGRDREHWVGPILTDTTFIAYYDGQLMCPIVKSPRHRWGFIYADGDTFWDAESHIFWWSPGPPHEIGVSEIDSAESVDGDTIRYFFREWSDGGDLFHWTDSIFTPTYFVAYYDQRMQIQLRKNPPHEPGWFLYELDTIDRVSEVTFWADSGETPTIGVSEFNIADYPGWTNDSVWTFQNWSDGGARIHTLPPLSRPGIYTANYRAESAVMDFSIIPNEWEVGDDLPLNYTVTMDISDMITVTNLGNVPIDLGFRISDPGPWISGFLPGADKFVLRLHINDDPTPPTTFSLVNDYVKEDLQWATNGLYGRFGPCGSNIYPPPYAAPYSIDYIWMQFITPTYCTTGDSYDTRITITMECIVRYHMP